MTVLGPATLQKEINRTKDSQGARLRSSRMTAMNKENRDFSFFQFFKWSPEASKSLGMDKASSPISRSYQQVGCAHPF